MPIDHETTLAGALVIAILLLAIVFLFALPGCEIPAIVRLAENADALAKAQLDIKSNVDAIAEITTEIAATASLDVQAVKVQAETMAAIQGQLDVISTRYEALELTVGQAIAEGSAQNLGSGTQFVLTGGSWGLLAVALIWGWTNSRSNRAIRAAASDAAAKRPPREEIPFELATALDRLESIAERRRRGR